MGVKILIHQHLYGTHMCVTNKLQRHIARFTNDGEDIARFLAETMQGKHPDAKYHHKLEAAKLLTRYGSCDSDPFALSLSKGLPSARSGDESAGNPDTADNRPPLPQGEGWGEGEEKSPPSMSESPT